MSAFIVESKVISGIIGFLAHRRNLDSLRMFIARETGYSLDRYADRCALGQAMFELNCNAVSQRYNEPANGSEYRYGVAATLSAVQAFKSLKCWLYQCSEGDVPDTPLYQVMDKVSDRLAHHIVSSLPEYERAEW